jgi:hypothetical protein
VGTCATRQHAIEVAASDDVAGSFGPHTQMCEVMVAADPVLLAVEPVHGCWIVGMPL